MEVTERLLKTKVYRMAVGTLQYMVVDSCDVQNEVSVLARQIKSHTARSRFQLKRPADILLALWGPEWS